MPCCALSGLVSVGVGVLVTPWLNLRARHTLRRAVPVTLAVSLFAYAAAVLPRLDGFPARGDLLAPLVLGTAFGSLLGPGWAARWGAAAGRKLLAVALAFIGAWVLATA